MLIYALGAFAIGATAGIFLAFRHFVHKRLPVWVALAHGVGGATGFTLVLLTVVQQPTFTLAKQALYLFIVTIALGCVNLLFHVRRVRHRTSLIVMHALTAVSGVLTLIYAIATGPGESPAVAATQRSAAEATPTATETAAPAAPSAAEAVASAAPSPAPSASAPGPSPAAGAPAAAGELTLDPALKSALSQPFAFGSNSATVLTSSVPALGAIAKALKEHPEVASIEVQGHADSRGSDEHNVELTRARAAAVVQALVSMGVEKERLHAAGYGARCPLNPACAGSDAPPTCLEPGTMEADRRVVFVPLKAGNTSFVGDLVCERGRDLIPADDRKHQR
jgi:outer membrane protein OmpA-like peptidoglycan-associated protein